MPRFALLDDTDHVFHFVMLARLEDFTTEQVPKQTDTDKDGEPVYTVEVKKTRANLDQMGAKDIVPANSTVKLGYEYRNGAFFPPEPVDAPPSETVV